VDALAGKVVGTDGLAVSLPFHLRNASEYGPGVLMAPKQVLG
jgi:hypothetical protein